MTKKTFLKKLREKLNSLDEKMIDEIISNYEKVIDEEIADGKMEKEVIASLGNVDLIAKLYLDKKDSKEEPTNKSTTSQPNGIVESIIKFVSDMFDNVNDKLAKRILEILCFVFIAIIILSIINIPFKILEHTGYFVFNIIFNHNFIYQTVRITWSVILNICYAFTVILFVIYYIQALVNKYYNYNINFLNDEVKTYKEAKAKSNDKNSDSAVDVLTAIAKAFVVVATIPIIFVELGLITALGIVILLLVKGVAVWGIGLILLGIISLIGNLLSIIYTSLFKRGDK